MNSLKRSFTLVEMLVVIAIIGILAGILLPVLNSARARGHETDCANNLRQIMMASIAYRQDYGGKRLPGWISDIYGSYLKSKDVYRCAADMNDKNTPAENWKARNDDHWQEIYDRPGNVGITYYPNPAVGNVSYFYEFPDARCDWWHDKKELIPSMDTSSVGTWFQVKTEQLRKGKAVVDNDNNIVKNPDGTTKVTTYSPDKFPVIRCFWHVKNIEDYDADLDNSFRKYWETDISIPDNAEKVINVSFNGNVFYSTATWENKTWSP